MKALSLWQPWGSLWLSRRKLHETRGWRMAVPAGGFWLAVHAAKRIEKDVAPALHAILDDEFGPHWARELPIGALLGCVRIVACEPTEMLRESGLDQDNFVCGNFDDGRFGFRREEYRILREAVPYSGRQGFFNVPDDIMQGPFL